MIFLKNIAIFFYRMWFYFLMFIYIVVFLPILLVGILKETWYPFFFWMARGWAIFILFGMGFIPVVKREVEFVKGQNYMFVANHTSMTDIMLMLYLSKNPFVFVGKKERSKIPLFGFFYRRTCILVDRSDAQSRREVFNSAQRKLNLGYSVCIFPEGGVPDDESVLLDQFKPGAFRLAIEHNINIAPMTFHDNKRLFSYTFFSGGPGRLRVKSHKFIETNGLDIDATKNLNIKAHTLIFNTLNEQVALKK